MRHWSADEVLKQMSIVVDTGCDQNHPEDVHCTQSNILRKHDISSDSAWSKETLSIDIQSSDD